MTRRRQVTCTCDAYPFPHRQGGGGRCCADEHKPARRGWAAFRDDTRRSMRLFGRLEMENAR